MPIDSKGALILVRQCKGQEVGGDGQTGVEKRMNEMEKGAKMIANLG